MVTDTQRLAHIGRFYELLARQEKKVRGKRILSNCNGRMDWPQRGVYFFFEPGELRTTSGAGLRVVRVGTHALDVGGQATLWQRLRTHRGNVGGKMPGGGNHRSSVFRLNLGAAFIQRDRWPASVAGSWGIGKSAEQSILKLEYPLEKTVSLYIGKMPFLWIAVNDPAGPDSLRAYIESNTIALLSHASSYTQPFGSAHPIDPPTPAWLGHFARSDAIRRSGLWNSDFVAQSYDPEFLDILQSLI